MKKYKPVIGITMGDPVGVGPEIVLKAFQTRALFDICRPVIFGDLRRLDEVARMVGNRLPMRSVAQPGASDEKLLQVVDLSDLTSSEVVWGRPTPDTGKAMLQYITTAADMALQGRVDAVVTAPINKTALRMAGSRFAGHTELLADRTGAGPYAMMMAGDRMRIILVTIHVPLSEVPGRLSIMKILETIRLAYQGLVDRFGIREPRVAVAGLNPHAGEDGMFGSEEADVIAPACKAAIENGFAVSGPFPPDTVFYQALNGAFDAVVCMYHDQGLIPFKLIHFEDGVNTTLGLPIIRTSVDHGTAYDIAGKGIASAGSMVAAVRLAAQQAGNVL